MKQLKRIAQTCLAVSAVLLASCTHEPELKPGTPDVCFDRDIMLIVNSNCNVAGCHGSGDRELEPLSTYEDLRSLVEPGNLSKSKLHEVITANPGSEKYMPPKSKPALSKEQIDMISIWIMQGANHTTCL